MLTLEKIHSQSYRVTAPRGKAKDRDYIFKSLFWKHSKHVEGYIFAQAFRDGRWNGKQNNFSATNIRAGFLRETIETLNQSGEQWTWKDEEKTNEDIIDFEEFKLFCTTLIKTINPSYKKKHGFELAIRDYQINTAYKAVTESIGIVEHATGAGKSLTIAFVIGYLFHTKRIGKLTIMIPRQQLITQFKNDLLDFGFSKDIIGVLFGKKKETEKPITIATYQTLSKLIDTSTGKYFFESQDALIYDEVHTASSKSGTNATLEFKNSKYFFGFTGTLPENELDRDVIHSLFGDVLDSRKLKELNEEYDAVTKVKVGMLEFNYGRKSAMDKIKRGVSQMGWLDEVAFLHDDDEFRNRYILNTIWKTQKLKKNIVVLVKNIAYGEKIFDKLNGVCDNIFCIFGSGKESKELEERDKIVEECRKSDENYIIVTNFQIFAVGINIPNIHQLFLIDAGKSKITVCQSIGRGVRRMNDKNEVFILDCYADLKYSSQHGRKRKKLYEAEGFQIFEKTIYKDEENEVRDRIKKLKKEK